MSSGEFHRRSEYTYRPAWWVRGGHAQTLWGKFFRRRGALRARVERWKTPDGDFIDLHRLDGAVGAPRLFFSTASKARFGRTMSRVLRRSGATRLGRRPSDFSRVRRRAEPRPRFYHSGDTGDLAFALDRVLAEHPTSPIVLAGVSLGGNVLLKYLGERGAISPRESRGAAAISVPFDLERGARYISTGFSRIYDRHFLRTLRQKALRKARALSRPVRPIRLERAQSIYEFDDAVTAPVHGFADAHDYYARSSSLGWIERIRRPTLLLSAIDDPFLPAAVLDEVRAIAARQSASHARVHGARRTRRIRRRALAVAARYYAEWRACEFLAQSLR